MVIHTSAAETSCANATAGNNMHLAIQVDSLEHYQPCAETSGANATAGSNLHLVIQVDSLEHSDQQFVKKLLDLNLKNDEFLKLLENYFDHTNRTINFYAAAVQKYLNSTNQSLIQDGEEGSFKAAVSISDHDQLFHDLAGAYRQEELMHNSLRSFGNDLAQKLHRAKVWTKGLAIFFKAAVVITTVAGAAAATIARNPEIAAAAAAVPILLGTIRSCTLSLLSKYMDGVEKHVQTTRCMAFRAKATVNDLTGLHSSALRFELQTKSADAGEVREEVEGELSRTWRRPTDYRLARAVTLQIVNHHILDSTTRDEVDNNGVGEAKEIGALGD